MFNTIKRIIPFKIPFKRKMNGCVLDVELSRTILKKTISHQAARLSIFGVISITNGGSHEKSKFNFPISMA